MQIKTIKLKNSLDVMLINLPDSYSVSINVFAKSGSRSDPIGKEGLAHFLEHMFFKGTKKYPSTMSFASAIENIGGDTNAYTGSENTCYYIKLPYNKVKEGIELLSEMIENPLYLDIDKERSVILEEIKMYNDDPQNDIYDNMFLPTLFGNTTLKVSPTGYSESVSKISIDDISNFKDENYVSNNMLITVSGNIDFVEVEKYLSNSFSFLKENPNLKKKKEEFSNVSKNVSKDRGLEQAHIILGCHTYDYFNPSRYALSLGNVILGQGFTSKLFHTLREKNGLSYYQSSGSSHMSDTGMYMISAGVNMESVKKAQDLIENCILEMKKGDFSEDDLKRAKTMIESGLRKDIETAEDFASFFGLEYLKKGEFKTVEEYIKISNSISKDQIVEEFNKILNEDDKVVCLLS
jgi:predicted Zn-dependent peptidase